MVIKDMDYKLLRFFTLLTLCGIWFQNYVSFFSPSLNRLLGITAGIAMLACWRHRGVMQKVISKEILLWSFFILWSGVTGFFVAVNQGAMLNQLIFLVQLTALILEIQTMCVIRKDIKPGFAIILLPPFFFLGFLLATGQINLISGSMGSRLGVLDNTNTIGFLFLSGTIGLLFLFHTSPQKIFRAILVGFIIVFAYIIFQTGSRKNTLSLFFLLALFYYLCILRRQSAISMKSLILFALVCIVVIVGYTYLLPWLVENTYVGKRLLSGLAGQMVGDQVRTTMYWEALEYLGKSPIWGLGLDQFRYHSITGKYSHSDYAEILACTGLLGALLYFPIYALAYRKLLNIRKQEEKGSRIWTYAGIMITMLLVQLALNFGRVGFAALSNWSCVALIISFTSIYGGRQYGITKQK